MRTKTVAVKKKENSQNCCCVCLLVHQTNQTSVRPWRLWFCCRSYRLRTYLTFLRKTTELHEGRQNTRPLSLWRMILQHFPLHLMETLRWWRSLHGYVVVLVLLTAIGQGKYWKSFLGLFFLSRPIMSSSCCIRWSVMRCVKVKIFFSPDKNLLQYVG